MIKTFSLAVVALATSLCLAPAQSEAATFTLTDGIESVGLIAGGEGRGRGIAFEVTQDVSITSVGIFVDLVQQSYDVQIYDSTDGNDVGSLLAEATAEVGGAGAVFNDISISFDFMANSLYAILWQPTDLGFGDWVAGNTAGGYGLDGNLPNTVGPFNVINGFDGNENLIGFENGLHPVIRVTTSDTTAVPLPAGGLFLMAGIAGLCVMRRRSPT